MNQEDQHQKMNNFNEGLLSKKLSDITVSEFISMFSCMVKNNRNKGSDIEGKIINSLKEFGDMNIYKLASVSGGKYMTVKRAVFNLKLKGKVDIIITQDPKSKRRNNLVKLMGE